MKYCARCHAPKSARNSSLCANWHPWDESTALTRMQLIDVLQNELFDYEEQQRSASAWGAAVGVRAEYIKGLRSQIARLKEEHESTTYS